MVTVKVGRAQVRVEAKGVATKALEATAAGGAE